MSDAAAQVETAAARAAAAAAQEASAQAEEAKANLEVKRSQNAAHLSAVLENPTPETARAYTDSLTAMMEAGKMYTSSDKAAADAQNAAREAARQVEMAKQAAVDRLTEEARASAEEEIRIYSFDYAAMNQEASIAEVSKMAPVVTLQGNEISFADGNVRQKAISYFDQIGGLVYNSVLGDVEVGKHGVKASIAHKIYPSKALAFTAVPSIISGGKIVSAEKNWKGRGYDTFVIAAPFKVAAGDLAGDYWGGAIVKRLPDSQKFYVHDVLLQKRTDMPFSPGGAARKADVDSGGTTSPSLTTLLERIQNVNDQNIEKPSVKQGLEASVT